MCGTLGDPELYLKSKLQPRYDLPASKLVIVRRVAAILYGDGIPETFCVIRYIVAQCSLFERVVPPLLVAAATVALCLSGLWWVAAIWFTSLVTVFAAASRLRIWTEHMGTVGTHRVHAGLLWRTFVAPHGIWLHWEHHRWMSVPYYDLPKARVMSTGTAPIVSVNSLLASYR
jgi:fatty acid desaturase